MLGCAAQATKKKEGDFKHPNRDSDPFDAAVGPGEHDREQRHGSDW
jgi:hypothetical protein